MKQYIPYYDRNRTHQQSKMIQDVKCVDDALHLILNNNLSYFSKYVLLSRFKELLKFNIIRDVPNLFNSYWASIYIRENVCNKKINMSLKHICMLYIDNFWDAYSLCKHEPEFYYYATINKHYFESPHLIIKLIKKHGYNIIFSNYHNLKSIELCKILNVI